MTATIIPFPGSRRQLEAQQWLARVQSFNFDMPMRYPPRIPGTVVYEVAAVLADTAATGNPWPSQTEIGRHVSFKRPNNWGETEHIYWALRSLKDAGFLHIERRNGKRNAYTLRTPKYAPISA